MGRLFKPRRSTPLGAAFEVSVVAVIMMILLAVTSFDGNPVQEAIVRAEIYLVVGTTGTYLLTSAYLVCRGIRSRGDLLFMRYGGGILLLAAFVAFHLLAWFPGRH